MGSSNPSSTGTQTPTGVCRYNTVVSAASLSDESRRQVRCIVFVSRMAGLLVAAALACASLFIHRGNLGSRESIAQLFTVGVGLGAFVSISTLTRVGHARILERSLREVGQLSDELRTLAERDPLTGLLNQRAFTHGLDEAIRRARGAGTSLSLIVADLDNFKGPERRLWTSVRRRCPGQDCGRIR